ncbi:hypothetical protein EST38_g4818 [Candolleomyces aberdarensis]|uniref:Uncharacterized protein n=1 Tax=Candolleomyces aberdarensis TaxID=2316362 RepID=A0A4Q2DQ13_9AGAR|nr:hypothetical protein EST38_g4818 [Candolleomyces aberdarensis]
MFHHDRHPSSFQFSAGPTKAYPRADDFPNIDAQQYPREYGPAPQCPPRNYPTSHLDGPPALGSYSSTPAPRSVTKMNWSVAKQIIMNQRVEVRLDGQGWVVGLALSCLKFFEVISGYGCQVRYTMPDGRGGDAIFPQADIRAL